MLNQIFLIAPLLAQAALAVPTTMSTAVRRQAEQTLEAAPQFIPPKMPYALKPQTKVVKPTAAASNDDDDDTVPSFIPPRMPFNAKAVQQKSTNEQASPQRLASVASLNNKKTTAKDTKNSKNTKNTNAQKLAQAQDNDDDKLPTFIPPRSPFRGPKKPQPTQAVPRDTVPEFIPPRNPWAQSKFNTRSTDSDGQGDPEETTTPDSDQAASRIDLLKRDDEDEGDEHFLEEDDDEFSPSDFPNLGGPEDDEIVDASNQDSEDIPAVNMSEQQGEPDGGINTQDDGNSKHYFGGDFDDEDTENTPTRLEARGVAKRNMLYFTNWGIYEKDSVEGFHPKDLPVNEITHVLYSFANVNAKDGTVVSSDPWADVEKQYSGDTGGGNNAYGCVKQLYILKKQNRNLKVLLSIGGFNGSPALASGVSTQNGRKRFISTAVKLITDWGFDGIDIDWEYPVNAQEARNYVLVLNNLRKALDKYSDDNKLNYRFLLTVASPAGSSHYNTMDLKNMDPWVDAWHLMAYDYAGPWDSTTGHQANVFASKKNPLSTKLSTDATLNDYIAAGVSPNKIHLGMPLYGRSFSNTAGLGKPYSGTAGDSEGIYFLKDLPQPGAVTTFNADLMASYTYDKTKRELVTMDDLKSAQYKANYINQRNLGGAFYWEARGDRAGPASVVAGVKRTLGTLEQRNNLLKYPTSMYDNIRNGMR
ncbi:Endochitinase B1 [Fusarium venenatum]|nr:Endochitinase B1 [Fusarium venenatum]